MSCGFSAFFSAVGVAAAEDEVPDAEDEDSVSDAGVSELELEVSTSDDEPPPKKPFSLPVPRQSRHDKGYR